MKFLKSVILFYLLPLHLIAQPTTTANDVIIPYPGYFRYGVNMGYYAPWQDHQLAEIAAGDAKMGLPGVGVNAVRPALFEHFFEYWGYDVRKEAFDRYESLGMTENVGFIGYPSDDHRDKTIFCPDDEKQESSIFKNLYEPIWDNGANGTPVNDENYYAIYLYNMVSVYKDYVKFWEVWNEPDFSFTVNSEINLISLTEQSIDLKDGIASFHFSNRKTFRIVYTFIVFGLIFKINTNII